MLSVKICIGPRARAHIFSPDSLNLAYVCQPLMINPRRYVNAPRMAVKLGRKMQLEIYLGRNEWSESLLPPPTSMQHGCQMAIAKFLYCMHLALRA